MNEKQQFPDNINHTAKIEMSHEGFALQRSSEGDNKYNEESLFSAENQEIEYYHHGMK